MTYYIAEFRLNKNRNLRKKENMKRRPIFRVTIILLIILLTFASIATSILNNYNLAVGLYVFDQVGNYLPGAIYQHVFEDDVNITGSLFALGLTRTPDIRLTSLGLLSYYAPRLYRSEYTTFGTSRLAILQLGLVGGV